MQERPSNYCENEECAGSPECDSYEPPLGKTQRYPDDESFKVEVDLTTRYLETTGSYPVAMPDEIDPGNSAFGSVAAVEGMTSESLDGFAIIANCLPDAGCSELSDPCPMSVPGLVDFEVLHLAFRTAALFKTSWSEIPACTQYEPSGAS